MKHCRKFKRTHFTFVYGGGAKTPLVKSLVNECELKVFDLGKKLIKKQGAKFDEQGWPVHRVDANGNVSRFHNLHKTNGVTLVLEIRNGVETISSMYRDGILVEQIFKDVAICYHRDILGTSSVNIVPNEMEYGRKENYYE